MSTIRFCISSGKSADASRSGCPDVGGAGNRRGPETVDRPELLGQPLDECVLAERDDAGRVTVGHLVEARAKEGKRILATFVAHRIREVDDEDRREAVHRQDELEPGEGEDQRGQEERPDGDARRAAAPSRSVAAPRGAGRT